MSQDMTLWTLVGKIAKDIPFNKDRIEHLLNVKLAIKEQSSEYYTFWDGESKMSVNAVRIKSAFLRLNNKLGGTNEMLLLNLEGKCIAKAEILQHYPNITLFEMPRGRSLDEVTTYVTGDMGWGDISFSFAERNPACLSRVGFHTKE